MADLQEIPSAPEALAPQGPRLRVPRTQATVMTSITTLVTTLSTTTMMVMAAMVLAASISRILTVF